jgi:hypothetical protein
LNVIQSKIQQISPAPCQPLLLPSKKIKTFSLSQKNGLKLHLCFVPIFVFNKWTGVTILSTKNLRSVKFSEKSENFKATIFSKRSEKLSSRYSSSAKY